MFKEATRKDWLALGLMIGAIIFLIVATFWFIIPSWANNANASQETCPATGDWVKVDNLDGYSYTYTPEAGYSVTDNCYKHATYVHFGTGETVTADEHCNWEWVGNRLRYVCKTHELSHASFKLVKDEVTPTVTPTPTEIPEVVEPKVRLTSMCQIDEETGKMRFREENGGEMVINWSARTAGGSEFDNGSIKGGETIYFNAPAGKTIIVDWTCSDGCKDSGKETKAQNTNACEVEPTPTPEPEPTPVSPPPSTSGSSTGTPVCTDGSTSKLVANLHVWRNGTQADVNFFITEGNHANIYYKVNGNDGWQYSVIGVEPNSDNFVSYTINGLDSNEGYTFGVQQTQGCGTGEIATAVVVDPPAQGKLFRFSFWIW